MVLSDQVYFHNAPDCLRDALDEHFKIENPAYKNVMRFSTSGGRYTQVPEHIRGLKQLSPSCFSLPRAVQFPDKAVAPYAEVVIQDKRTKVPVEFPAVRVTLNPMQKQLLTSFQKACLADIPDGLLLKAGTSFGKTIGMLRLAAEAGQRTLILTHRKLIFDVWLAEIEKVFGWGRTHACVGSIQGAHCQLGTHITVAMLQTLSRQRDRYQSSFFNSFGTVILDEAHICPMPFIEDVVSRCGALYRIGGTATLDRTDGLEKLLYWHFGKPFFTNTDSRTVKANQIPISEVRLVNTRFKYEPEEEDIFDIHALNQQLIHDGVRNRLIIKNVIADLKEEHYVLLTTSFKKHVAFLVSRLKQAGYHPFVFTGDRAQGNRAFDEQVAQLQRGEHRLLVATEQLIREGTNLPPLNRLHVAFPHGNPGTATQLFGRIQRASPHTNKVDAKVTLYFDILTPTLRRRVMRVMLPALKKLGVTIPELWVA